MSSEKRVLVVEDVQSTLRGTVMELRLDGIIAEWALTIDEAVRKLRERVYDVMILDWRLPLVAGGPVRPDAGALLLEKVASGEVGNEAKGVPVVIVTSEGAAVDRAVLEKYKQCIDLISKLYPDDIRQRVNSILGVETDDV